MRLLIITVLMFPTVAFSADTAVLGFGRSELAEPISTDRPDFTETADSVEKGHLQFETGYTFAYDDSSQGTSAAHVVPEVLARAGITDGFELRFVWLGYTYERELGESVEGGSDFSVGFKLRLTEQEELLPQLSMIGAIIVPSGAGDTRSEDVAPEVKLLWAYDLGEPWGISGNINFLSPVSDDGRYFAHAASVAISRAITDTIGVYGEVFGIYAKDGGQRASNFLDGGITYLLSPAMQLDIRVGVGLNDAATDMFSGVGFSWCI